MVENICNVKNCPNHCVGRGVCSRHWQQLRKYGQVITKEARNQSPIVIKKDYAEIGLIDAFDNIVAWTKISKEDLGFVAGKKLRCDKGKYAVFYGSKELTRYLHRTILKTDLEVDHANGDGLDNRRSNLRAATHGQNGANKNRGKLRGVRKRGDKYEAYASVKIDGKKTWVYLGVHKTLEDAMRKRDEFSIRHFGDFAVLNIN